MARAKFQNMVQRVITPEDLGEVAKGDDKEDGTIKSFWKAHARKTRAPGDPEEMEQARKAYAAAAWKDFEESCEMFLSVKKCETFDVCAVAWLHGVLYGKMGEFEEASTNVGQVVPLHRAIKHARAERQRHRVDRGEGHTSVVSDKDIMEMVWKLANRLTSDACKCLGPENRDKDPEDPDKGFQRSTGQLASCIRSLLIHPRVHSINVHDLNASNRKVSQIVQSDRLPKKNSLEGLLLLQQAWCDRDISNFLADRYKFYTKFLYLAQLLCSWLVVLFTQLDSMGLSATDTVFLMSILSGAIVSAEGVFRPKPKWHALRKGTFNLESMIWCCLAAAYVLQYVRWARPLAFLVPSGFLFRAAGHWRQSTAIP